MGRPWSSFKPRHHVILDPCQLPRLAFSCRRASEGKAAGAELPSYRRNACSGTFRTGQKKYDRLLHVGVLFYKKQQSSDPDV